MNLSAWFHDWRHGDGDHDRGAAGAIIVAILFAIVAALSFAVEHSVTLSKLPEPPARSAVR